MSQVGSDREQLLSRAFVRLADTLVDDYDIIDLLDRLVSYSVELLTADAAGILLADSQHTLQVVASSHEDAHVMELLQLQSHQGPCMESFNTGEPVSVPDLADVAGRWPVFVAAVAERGAYRSAHALPLRLRLVSPRRCTSSHSVTLRSQRATERIESPSAGPPTRC
jgi:GAF domain-containing protein